MTSTIIHFQPSRVIESDCIRLAVTELGGHMAPVVFERQSLTPIQPYYISPWQDEELSALPGCMGPLRGDFFCLPFGRNTTPWHGEQHPAHGETCGNAWHSPREERAGDRTTLHIEMRTRARPGIVRRAFTLIDGHNAVYCHTRVEGFHGTTPFSHHATLRVPDQPGALRVSSKRFDYGRTYPVPSGDPAQGEYQSLAIDTAFRSMERVPSIFRGEPTADCTRFPAREGFCDLFQTFEKPSAFPLPSWVAAVNTNEHYLWFALKDPALMPGRMFWSENHGRHGAPWSGRNRCLGVEDGCMYFDRGLAESCAPNPINRLGIPTCVDLTVSGLLEVRYIQGAVRVPPSFDQVANVRFGRNQVTFKARSGAKLTVPLDTSFLFA